MENLIKKHEAFEKAAAAQEERFAALERLTTVSTPSHFPESAFLSFNQFILLKNCHFQDLSSFTTVPFLIVGTGLEPVTFRSCSVLLHSRLVPALVLPPSTN